MHHVIEAFGVSMWDWLFLASGIVLILASHAIARKSSQGDLAALHHGTPHLASGLRCYSAGGRVAPVIYHQNSGMAPDSRR